MPRERFSKSQPYRTLGDGIVTKGEERILRFGRQKPFSARASRTSFLTKSLAAIFRALDHSFGPFFAVEDQRQVIASTWGRALSNLKEKHGLYTVAFRENFNDQPKIHHILLEGKEEGISDGLHTYGGVMYGMGVSGDSLDDALGRAVGEYIERRSLYVYREAKLTKSSPKKLKRSGRRFVDPMRFFQISEQQQEEYKLLVPDETSEYLWEKVREVSTGVSWLVPAQVVYWNYNPDHTDWKEPIIFQSNTNGSASWTSRNGAIARAIYELIERDGFLIYWLNEISPKRIDPESFTDPKLLKLITDCRRYFLEPHFLVTVTDLGVPSLAMCLEDKTEAGIPHVVFSGSAGVSFERIAYRSLLESLNVFTASRRKYATEQSVLFFEKAEDHLKQPFHLHERVKLWANPKMDQHMRFFIRGPLVRLESLRQYEHEESEETVELQRLLTLFKKKGEGYEVYCFEGNQSVLREHGMHAVKVVVPKLVSMYFSERTAPYGSARLREVPRSLGLIPREPLFPWPHPFP